MKVALVNPRWNFENSIYFGCREPHLPLELGAAKTLLERDGHDVLMLDGALDDLDNAQLAARVAGFGADLCVVTTAPTYLFWRCAQPELRSPRAFLDHLGETGGVTVAVGPHGSTTPGATLAKLGVDLVIRGECEELIVRLANGEARDAIQGLAWRESDAVRITGAPVATRFADLPPISWPNSWIRRHDHHHHRFGDEQKGFGAEVEASRGCPYACSFCAKIDFRDAYRRRDIAVIVSEIDALITQGVGYVYFVDEIFLPQKELLEALRDRDVKFGVQTRIDLWKPQLLDLLGDAGCVSIEAGVESLTPEGRAILDKNCRLSTEELTDRLIHARRRVPFVQANLIRMDGDDARLVADWRKRLDDHGIWANDPVPLFPYPASPDYRRLFGAPDDLAWERAHDHYLAQFDRMSDIQDQRPSSLCELEAACRNP